MALTAPQQRALEGWRESLALNPGSFHSHRFRKQIERLEALDSHDSPQTYPQSRMEWVVVDDGIVSAEDLYGRFPNTCYLRLDPVRAVLTMAHPGNTFDKQTLLVNPSQDKVQLPDWTLFGAIPDPGLRADHLAAISGTNAGRSLISDFPGGPAHRVTMNPGADRVISCTHLVPSLAVASRMWCWVSGEAPD